MATNTMWQIHIPNIIFRINNVHTTYLFFFREVIFICSVILCAYCCVKHSIPASDVTKQNMYFQLFTILATHTSCQGAFHTWDLFFHNSWTGNNTRPCLHEKFVTGKQLTVLTTNNDLPNKIQHSSKGNYYFFCSVALFTV